MVLNTGYWPVSETEKIDISMGLYYNGKNRQ